MDNSWKEKYDEAYFRDKVLPEIYEIEDVSKKVINTAGSSDFYPTLDDALSELTMKRTFGKNSMRKDVAKDVLLRLGYPDVLKN
jgi:hypothetical protein